MVSGLSSKKEKLLGSFSFSAIVCQREVISKRCIDRYQFKNLLKKNLLNIVVKMTTKRTSDLQNNITSFTLCRACSNCPVVEVHHDTREVIITDDFGGKVKLTIEEWKQAVKDVTLE